jgi:hypothetical protein
MRQVASCENLIYFFLPDFLSFLGGMFYSSVPLSFACTSIKRIEKNVSHCPPAINFPASSHPRPSVRNSQVYQ